MRCVLFLVPVGLGLVLGEVMALEAPGRGRELARRVRIILRDHCFSCHGQDPENIEGDGLNILDRGMLIERHLVVPKKPAESRMMRKIEMRTMPPPGEGTSVPADQIKVLRAWIDAGAAPFADD
jgi:hypothetical protein